MEREKEWWVKTKENWPLPHLHWNAIKKKKNVKFLCLVNNGRL